MYQAFHCVPAQTSGGVPDRSAPEVSARRPWSLVSAVLLRYWAGAARVVASVSPHIEVAKRYCAESHAPIRMCLETDPALLIQAIGLAGANRNCVDTTDRLTTSAICDLLSVETLRSLIKSTPSLPQEYASEGEYFTGRAYALASYAAHIQSLVRISNPGQRSDAYAAGLMCHIGINLIAQHAPERLADVRASLDGNGNWLPYIAQVSSDLAVSFRLPSRLQSAIKWVHKPLCAPDLEFYPLPAILYLADWAWRLQFAADTVDHWKAARIAKRIGINYARLQAQVGQWCAEGTGATACARICPSMPSE